MKYLILLMAALLLPASVFAQYHLTGKVVDANDKPISQVRIEIPALHLRAASNTNGEFEFQSVPKQELFLTFNILGYQKSTQIIDKEQIQDKHLIKLIESPLQIPMVTVTAEPQPTNSLETPLTTTSIDIKNTGAQYLSCLGTAVNSTPGITGFSGGNFSVKPVIRGLTGQRIIVLSNGVRSESQTWDDPQSPELAVEDAEKIEIVRGPNSVLYGSEALGGIINVISPDIWTGNEGAKLLSGHATVVGGINAMQGGGSLFLQGGKDSWGYTLQGSGKIAGDYSAPKGSSALGNSVNSGKVFNSGIEQFSAKALAGTKKEWGTFAMDYSIFGQNLMITPEPGRMEIEYNINTKLYDTLPAQPHQEIFHHRVNAYTNLLFGENRIEITGTFQHNIRKEEGVKESEEIEQKKEELGIKPEAELTLSSVELNVKAHHQQIGPLMGTIGLSGIYQHNSTDGQKAIIPSYNLANIAGFVYEEAKFGQIFNITGGLRFDSRSLKVDANSQLGNSNHNLDYNAVTGSLGMGLHLLDNLVLAVNAGSAWRAPMAIELFGLGADEGEVRYKLGNKDLTPETSLNLEGSLRYKSNNISAEVSVYQNKINDYIYLKPTGIKVEGLDSYKFSQDDATLFGGEFNLNVAATDWLVFGLGADYVKGTLSNQVNDQLPLMPAPRILPSITLLSKELIGLQNVSFSINSKIVLEQKDLADFEYKSPAYQLIDVSLNFSKFLFERNIHCTIGINNLLDEAYYDHLSRYKAYALNPGRSFFISFNVPFDIL